MAIFLPLHVKSSDPFLCALSRRQKACDRRSAVTSTLASEGNNSNVRRLSQIVPIGVEIRKSSIGNPSNYKPENPQQRNNAVAAPGADGAVASNEAGNSRMAPGGGFSFQNHDEKRLASARETRKISQGYGNQALRTSTIEQGLKVLTKQVRETEAEHETVMGIDVFSLRNMCL